MAELNSVAEVVAPVETAQVATPQTTNTDNGGKPNTSGDTAEAKANRFAFSQARENEKLRKELESYRNPKETPKFDEETDPDGRKEQEFIARKQAEEVSKQTNADLEARLEATEKRLAMDDFKKSVLTDAKPLEALGITVDADKAVATLLDIEKNGGVTSLQIAALAHLDDILKISPKKTMDAPGSGGVVKPVEKPKSKSEAFASVWAKHGM